MATVTRALAGPIKPSVKARFMTIDAQQWIWTCTKRLAELHPGEPMDLDDWENVATDLHRTAVVGDTPEKVAEAYSRMRASKAPTDD